MTIKKSILCLGGMIVLNIIYSEFLKLKKSFILVIVLISGILMPGILFIVSISDNLYKSVPATERVRFVENNIIDIERMSALFVYIIIFSLIAAFVFSREYTDKTVSIVYSYPFSRGKIFLGKFIIIYALIALVYIIQAIAAYLSSYIVWGTLPTAKFITADIKVNIYSMLLQFLIIPIPVLIGNITKGIIFPIVYGIFGDVISGIFLAEGAKIYSQFCPLSLPALPFYHYHMGDPIDLVITTGSGVISFCLFMFFCIYQHRNADMN